MKRLLIVVLAALSLSGCSVALAGRASVFQREVADEEKELSLVRRLLIGGGEDAARAYLKARGYTEDQITKRIDAAKAAKE